jgi:hypothetical protein
MMDYRIYGGIGDTIKIDLQTKQAFFKKVTTWMLVFVTLSMAVLETIVTV